MYTVLFLTRRFIYGVILMIYQDWPLFGIQALYLMSICTLIYLAVVRPFETRSGNNSEIFNELCILGCINHLYMYTDYYTDVNIQRDSGWSSIAIIAINILVNTFMIVLSSAVMIRNLFRKIVSIIILLIIFVLLSEYFSIFFARKMRLKYRIWKHKRELARTELL